MTDHDKAQLHQVRWDDVDGRRVRSLEVGRADPAVAPVVLMPGLGALVLGGLTFPLFPTRFPCSRLGFRA